AATAAAAAARCGGDEAHAGIQAILGRVRSKDRIDLDRRQEQFGQRQRELASQPRELLDRYHLGVAIFAAGACAVGSGNRDLHPARARDDGWARALPRQAMSITTLGNSLSYGGA